MNKNYRAQLMITLTLFAFTLTSIMSVIDYYQFKGEMKKKNDNVIEQAFNVITFALQYIDETIHMHGSQIDEEMKEALYYFQSYYEENDDVSTWDLHALKNELGYDIYIIDEADEIIQSNVKADIGINFNECCTSLKKILDERRKVDQAFIDGIEISQKDGALIKFGYITTKDKRYIIEIGLNIAGSSLETIYNYLDITNELVDKFEPIESIHILNMGGYSYNMAGYRIEDERLDTFRQARDSHDNKEMAVVASGDQTVFYRYIPIILPYEQGTTKQKVIEIAYNENELSYWVAGYTKRFIFQMAFILLMTILLSSVILKRFMRISYLAYHDKLTGLANRLAFEEDLEIKMKEAEPFAIAFVDLDRFKLINDHLGYQKGDMLLQTIGLRMKSALTDGKIYRLGGDEFMIIFKYEAEEDVFKQIEDLLDRIESYLVRDESYQSFQLSASAGVVFAKSSDTATSLKEKADLALQEAKLKGKNQYQIYRA